jgi:hypothetical protein
LSDIQHTKFFKIKNFIFVCFRMMRLILSLIGAGLMYYEKIVDENMAEAELVGEVDYEPSCDIKFSFFGAQEVSCSKILKSDYAVGFGFLDKVKLYYEIDKFKIVILTNCTPIKIRVSPNMRPNTQPRGKP